MNWYYTIGPSHTRVRVFMNGANCGELCFRNEEFQGVKHYQETLQFSYFDVSAPRAVTFINETPQPCPP